MCPRRRRSATTSTWRGRRLGRSLASCTTTLLDRTVTSRPAGSTTCVCARARMSMERGAASSSASSHLFIPNSEGVSRSCVGLGVMPWRRGERAGEEKARRSCRALALAPVAGLVAKALAGGSAPGHARPGDRLDEPGQWRRRDPDRVEAGEASLILRSGKRFVCPRAPGLTGCHRRPRTFSFDFSFLLCH